MIIKYPNGRTVEAALLARHGNCMRVALENSQDVVEFIDAQGTWLSEGLETVEITFEWQRRLLEAEQLHEEDFLCSPDLAAHLLRLLDIGSDEEQASGSRQMAAGMVM
jgi:hypothetical protein